MARRRPWTKSESPPNQMRTAQQHREAAMITRFRLGKVSFRLHEHLRSALDYLAAVDHRSLSQYIEMVLLENARARLENAFDHRGGPARVDELGKPWKLRDCGRPE